MLVAAFRFLGELVLRLYPSGFREAFAEEMRDVFLEALEDASRKGIFPLLRVGMRELLHAPPVILRTMNYHPKGEIQNAAGSLRDPEGDETDLDLPAPDGSQSWRQAVLELIPFLAGGAALVLLTYFPFLSPEPGWQRLPGTLGMAMLILPLPAFLLGAARGMPRWAYPCGGMLLSYCLYSAIQLNLGFYTLALLASSIGLAYAAWMVDERVRRLPRPLRQVFHSIKADWTRCSFGLYGGMPLLVLLAFDNGVLDNRGPALAISVILMVGGAMSYIRGRGAARQTLALLTGMSLSFWTAFFDGTPIQNGLQAWLTDTAWMPPVWLASLGILLFPVLFKLAVTGIGMARVRRIGGNGDS